MTATRKFSFIFGMPSLKYFNSTEIFRNEYIVFVQDRCFDETESTQDITHSLRESTKRVGELVKKLKLLKDGHLKLLSSFLFSDKLGIFPNSFVTPPETVNYERYSLSKEINLQKNYLEAALLIPPYLELAFNSFLEYYNIEDKKLKFVMLMIALESIFNKSSQDPISHIISRDVALLLSNDRQSFLEIYKEVKRLYNLRSIIVYGKDQNEIKKSTQEFDIDVVKLEEIVRKVLKKLIWIHDFDLNLPRDKAELWTYLNTKGFPG